MDQLIQMTRGDNHVIYLNFDKSIEGSTIWFTVKSRASDSDEDAILRKIVTEHTDALLGKSKIEIVPMDTSTTKPKKYLFDIQIKYASGNVSTVVKGEFEVLYDITRSS